MRGTYAVLLSGSLSAWYLCCSRGTYAVPADSQIHFALLVKCVVPMLFSRGTYAVLARNGCEFIGTTQLSSTAGQPL